MYYEVSSAHKFQYVKILFNGNYICSCPFHVFSLSYYSIFLRSSQLHHAWFCTVLSLCKVVFGIIKFPVNGNCPNPLYSAIFHFSHISTDLLKQLSHTLRNRKLQF